MKPFIFSVVVLLIYLNTVSFVYGQTTSKPSGASTKQFQVPLAAIIFLAFLGGCLVFVFILYKILNSEICKLDRDRLGGTKGTSYVELGQSPPMGEDVLEDTDSVDFMEQETTTSDRSLDIEGDHGWQKPLQAKSRSLGDLLSDKPAKPPPRRKLTTWERPSIEAVKAATHLNVLTAYGDTSSTQVRKPRESRGEINCIAKLQVSVGFSQTSQRLEVTIIRVQDFPESISLNSATSAMSVHLTLMPSKRFRFKTKTKATADVTINETFVMRGVTENELLDSTFRFRIYAQGSMKKGKLLGETETNVTDFDLDDIVSTMWIMIPPVTEEHHKKPAKPKHGQRK